MFFCHFFLTKWEGSSGEGLLSTVPTPSSFSCILSCHTIYIFPFILSNSRLIGRVVEHVQVEPVEVLQPLGHAPRHGGEVLGRDLLYGGPDVAVEPLDPGHGGF